MCVRVRRRSRRCTQQLTQQTDNENVSKSSSRRFKSGSSYIKSVNPYNNTNASSSNSIKSEDLSLGKKHLRLTPLIPGLCVENNAVLLWSFPNNISQTRLGERKHPSNACTLISAALAEIIFRNGIFLPAWDGTNCINFDALYFSTKQQIRGIPIQNQQNILPSRLCDAMVNGIINGNARADLAEKRESELFTVPIALELLGRNFGEVSYVTSKSKHGDAISLLYTNLKSAIEHPSLSEWKQLFFVTMFVERCVLIVYERNTDSIAIFDSHSHKPFGAFIAVSNYQNLKHFCSLVITKFFPETDFLLPLQMKFEMSLIFFQGKLSDFDCPMDTKFRERIAGLQQQQKSKRPDVFENADEYLKEIASIRNLQIVRKKNRFLKILRCF